MKPLEKISFLGITFFTYCLIGWIYEVIITYYAFHHFENRGFLHGPYLPIYGFSAIFLILTLNKIYERKVYIKKVPITSLLIFLLTFIISSVIEYLTSYVLEKGFNLVLWDYYGYKYNLNGRISLTTSTYFGIGGLIIFYIVQPLLRLLKNKISFKILNPIGIAIILIMLLDLIITLIQ